MASKIGMLESKQATEILTSTLNGYKMEVQEASKVVDVFANLDMNAATSFKELGVAFQKTANGANDAGISFETLAAYITTVSEVTRKSASSIGESFKTMTARFQNIKLGKVMSGEADMEGINDTEKALSSVGITMRKSATEWRKMEDVLSEVGVAWEKYNQLQKNTIVVAMAGVRQSENLRALFGNWNKVIKYNEIALNSAGIAAEKYQTYLKSIEGRTKTMIATFQDIVHQPMFEELIKVFLSIVTAIGKVIDVIGLGNIIFAGFVMGLGKLLSMIKLVIPSISGLSAAMVGLLRGASLATLFPPAAIWMAAVAAVTLLIGYIITYKSALEKAQEKVKGLVTEQQNLEAEIENLNKKLEDNKDILEELSKISKSNRTDEINAEIASLNEQNKSLEIEIAYRKELANIKNKEATTLAEKTYKEAKFDTTKIGTNEGSFSGNQLRQVGMEEHVQELVSTGEEKAKILADLKAQYDSISEEDRKGYDKRIKVAEEELANWQKTIGKFDVLSYQDGMDVNSKSYKDLTGYAEDLTKASSMATTVVNATSEEAGNLATDIDDVGDSVSDTASEVASFTDVLDSFKSKSEALNTAISEFNSKNKLSSATMANLMSQFPDLESDIMAYNAGLVDSAGLLTILTQYQQNNLEAYKDSIAEKIFSDETYYNSALTKHADVVNALIADYGVDLSNFKDLASAKAAIDIALAGKLAKIWKEYYGGVYSNAISQDTFLAREVDRFKVIKDKEGNIVAGDAKAYAKAKSAYDQSVKASTDLKNAQDEIFAVDVSFENASDITGSDSSSSGDDKHKEAFDKEYKTLVYYRDKEIITQAEYFASLAKLNDKYFKGRAKYLDDYRQYDLEVQNGLLQVYTDNFSKRLDLSKNFVDKRNAFDDWGTDSEIDAWSRVLNWMQSEFYPKNLKEKEIFDKNYLEANQSFIQAIEDDFDKSMEKTAQARKVFEFENGTIDEGSIQNDMDTIQAIIEKGYYEVNGIVSGLTEAQVTKYQDLWMELHADRLSALESEKSKYEDLFSAASNIIDKEIDKLNDKKEIIQDLADIDKMSIELQQLRFDALSGGNEIIANELQKQIDYLAEQKALAESITSDEEKKIKLRQIQLEMQQLHVEQLKQELALISDQKTQRVYHEDQGWVWEADKGAIAAKEAEITDAQTAAEIAKVDEQIATWEDYKQTWKDVVDTYELEQDRLLLNQTLGKDAENDILNQRLDIVANFASEYNRIMASLISMSSETVMQDVPVPNAYTGKTVTADKNGNAPASTRVGDTVNTAGNKKFKVVEYGTPGSHYNPISNLSSIEVKHDGIESGLVGGMSFNPSTEVMAKLAKGEGVFSAKQMKNIVSNISSMLNIKPQSSPTSKSDSSTGDTIIENLAISLPEVKNASDFMKQMKNLVAITGKI